MGACRFVVIAGIPLVIVVVCIGVCTGVCEFLGFVFVCLGGEMGGEGG